MIFILVLLVLIAPITACSIGPDLKRAKPEPVDFATLKTNSQSQNTVAIVFAVTDALTVYSNRLYPPLLRLYQKDPSCEACESMRTDIRDAEKGAQLTYLSLRTAEESINRLSLNTEGEKRLAVLAIALIKEMRTITALTLWSLADAHAYVRSYDEKNLSQLTDQNEKSFNATIAHIEAVKHRILKTAGDFSQHLRSL